MALSNVQYPGDDVTVSFALTFGFISRDHITVSIDNVATTAFTWISDTTILMDAAVASGSVLSISRLTPRGEIIVDWQDGSVLVESDLDISSLQTFFLAQEAIDNATQTIIYDGTGDWQGQARRIADVAEPVDDSDVATKFYADNSTAGAVAAAAAQAAAESAEANALQAVVDAEAAVASIDLSEVVKVSAQTWSAGQKTIAKSNIEAANAYTTIVTYDGTTPVTADNGSLFVIDLSTHTAPKLPLPQNVPAGYTVTFLIQNYNGTTFQQNSVVIDGRTTENFFGYTYPLYTYGNNETIRFKSNGVDNWYVEVLQNSKTDVKAHVYQSTGNNTTNSVWAIPSANTNVQSIGNAFSCHTGSTMTAQVAVQGRYRLLAKGIAYNHGGTGATGSAFLYLDVGSSGAKYSFGSAAYGQLNASIPIASAETDVYAAPGDVFAAWYNIAAVGRAQFLQSNGGLYITYLGR